MIKKSSSALQLVHYTLHVYITHNSNLFIEPYSMIGPACLVYDTATLARLAAFRPLSVRSHQPSLLRIILPPTGVRALGGGHVKAVALEQLDGYDKHISSKVRLLRGALTVFGTILNGDS